MDLKKKLAGKVLVINRKEWRRGGDDLGVLTDKRGDTELLNSKGLMCCLGFDALGCGLTKNDIFEKGSPLDVVLHEGSSPALEAYIKARTYRGTNRKPVCAAIDVNDDDDISEAVREKRVRAALIKLGWKDVKFVG